MNYDIIEKLKREIEGFKDDPKLESVGFVMDVGDGVLKINGLKKVMSQEMVVVATTGGGVTAVALNLEEDSLGAMALPPYKKKKNS